MPKVVIGTRGSQLARWQANWVRARLAESHSGLEIELKIISTRGDREPGLSLPKLGEQGKGLFTKELEDEMLSGAIDIAVHSLKDLPTEMTPALHIGAISEREDVRDALVARAGIGSFDCLPAGSRIGTSSLRRQAQILAWRPDLRLEPIRGNVETRVRKIDDAGVDAVVLASAGLRRLGYEQRITQYIDPKVILPAVGQGALAIQCRADDARTNGLVQALNHDDTARACRAERAMLLGLGGGCLVPIAGLALVAGSQLRIQGLVARPDGSEIIRGEADGQADEPEGVGSDLARALLTRGAAKLLESQATG
jgi:hydroxymethylbilane synthase